MSNTAKKEGRVAILTNRHHWQLNQGVSFSRKTVKELLFSLTHDRPPIHFMSPTLQDAVQAVPRNSPVEGKTLPDLYDEYAGIVLGFLVQLTDDQQKAEEFLQKVFLGLPAQLPHFNPEKERFTLWLLRITRNLVQQLTGSHEEDQSKNADNPTNATIQREANSVHGSMSDEKPSAVKLLYVKGLTFAQTARTLGLNENDVHTLIRNELKQYRMNR